MEITQVLHMNGGFGETSYASNSLVQRKVISMTKPITEEAITELYYNRNVTAHKPLCMADLGCSSGPNTLFLANEVVKLVHKLCRKHGHKLPEFQIQLNDLPGTDFNLIFRSLLPSFQDELGQDMAEFEAGYGHRPSCFVSAVPGSFFDRLFPARSLHFVHSSYSLMWLSKVPEGVDTMNKENIYMASASPESVISEYYAQFKRDFSSFLRCRSDEVVGGGKMVLTLLGRKSDDACSKDGCYIWELMALSLKEMVAEGLIQEDKLHSFNIPQYTPSPSEVEIEVQKEGSFTVNRLEASEIAWAECGRNGFYTHDSAEANDGYNLAKCMRSVAESLLIYHFGEHIIDPLFDKYSKILTHRMSKEDAKFINVTVSMTRRE